MKCIFLFLLSICAFAKTQEQKDFSQDLKDSQKVHGLLATERKAQMSIDETIKSFVYRHKCESKNATLDGAGFMICTPVPQPPVQAPKPAEDKKETK